MNGANVGSSGFASSYGGALLSSGGQVAAAGAMSSGAGGESSTSAGAAGFGGDGLPLDDRPARPAWNPPFGVGDPGWAQSSVALCEKQQGAQDAFDVWADSRGVFALFSAVCNELADVPCGKDGVSLQFNDGTGWQLIYQLPPGSGSGGTSSLRLSGIPNGPVFISGLMASVLGLWIIDHAAATLQTDVPLGRVFAVNTDLAYAFSVDEVYRYQDGSWTAFASLPMPVQSLWADANTVVVVGQNQAVLKKGMLDADFVAVPGVPAADYSAVWGFGPNDIWTGNQAGQLAHYDGSAWQVLETGSRDVSGAGIVEMWGSEGQLYFRTSTEIGRWNGAATMLLSPPAGTDPSQSRITTGGLWGRSVSEVFVAVTDRTYLQYACGSQFMIWFDGTEFHDF